MWFGVQGLGFPFPEGRVSVFVWFGVQGLGFRVGSPFLCGLGFRV